MLSVLLLFFIGNSKAGPIYDLPPNLLVAYYGDLGLSNISAHVLKMVKAEKAELIVHAGDFDYIDDPKAFDSFLTEHLGPDFPYIASAGNHDVTEWLVYREVLLERYKKIPQMKCGGNVPETYWCIYRGIFFGVSSIGVLSPEYLRTSLELESYLNQSQELLKTEDGKSTWKVCVWHKNQHITQTGTKINEASWNPFETCRRHGAMISNGHEHSYARSYLINKFENPLQIARTDLRNTSPYVIQRGQTLFFVNGLGGKGSRPALPELATLPQWAKTFNSENGAKGVAVFCKYNVDGQMDKAYCYAKDVDQGIIDSWELISKNDGVLEPYVFEYV